MLLTIKSKLISPSRARFFRPLMFRKFFSQLFVGGMLVRQCGELHVGKLLGEALLSRGEVAAELVMPDFSGYAPTDSGGFEGGKWGFYPVTTSNTKVSIDYLRYNRLIS